MLLIFKKFLWVPVQEYFAKRADYIESTINEAKDMKEQAIVHINEAEKQARDAALQYHAIIDQAKEEGQKQKQKMHVYPSILLQIGDLVESPNGNGMRYVADVIE